MRSKVSDSDIASYIVRGKNNSEVARALHVDRKRVAAVRALTDVPTDDLKKPVPIDRVRAIVRLELSQEETLNEFTDQLVEYTKNYKAAMILGDHDTAGKWASLRLRLLESMIKISGLDQRPIQPPTPPQDLLGQMTDEEVERRAKAILARRIGQ